MCDWFRHRSPSVGQREGGGEGSGALGPAYNDLSSPRRGPRLARRTDVESECLQSSGQYQHDGLREQ